MDFQPCKILKTSWIETCLGPMMAIADDALLYVLEFADNQGLERKVQRLVQKTKSTIIPGRTPPINSIERELTQYFRGDLREFKTAVCFLGSPFQNRVWETLRKIPFGQTYSYANVAEAIEKPTAFRAVALANAANQLALIIPCHRVINASGNLSGYGGGVARKEWLINHERQAIIISEK